MENIMKKCLLLVLYLCVVFVVGIPGSNPHTQQRCYILVNGTQYTVHVTFQYPLPINDAVVSIDLIPGGRYTYCLNSGASSTATIWGVMWEGTTPCYLTSTLNMGFSTQASPPGTYTIQNQPRTCPDPSNPGGRERPEPPRHRELTDADCRTSAELPEGVYTIKNSLGDNICLGFEPDDASKVRLARCDQNQQRLFTFIREQDGCYLVRNGDVNGPRAGRCLDSDARRSNDQIFALACNRTKYQRWKLFKLSNGAYNLINKHSGQCLDRNSYHPDPGDEAHQYDCNGTEWQGWFLTFVRRQ